jgi:excinuclease UvrABC helicase subunit UvrB
MEGRLQEIIAELPSFKVKGRFFVDATPPEMTPARRERAEKAHKARARVAAKQNAVSPPRGGGDDVEAEIATLEAQIQQNVANLDFESCVPLRARIVELQESRARSAGTAVKTDLSALVSETKNSIVQSMQPFIAESRFEKCIPLRNDMQSLEALNKQYDRTSSLEVQTWRTLESKIRALAERYGVQ